MNILVALFSERESAAARLLLDCGITRIDVVKKLGTSDWKEPVVDVVNSREVGGGFVSSGVTFRSMPRTKIDRRLDALEEKWDTTIGEIRKISENLQLIMKRLPPDL